MNQARRFLQWLICLALFCPVFVAAQVIVPPLHERVVDLTNTLTVGQVQQLNAELRNFEDQKGSQIAVLIVPSTLPESIEQYSIRVAERWKLGRKNVDDGAILLIAKNDRSMRIEVGYGLEGALNDAVCKRIIDDIIAPLFKGGDYYAGIHTGIDTMMQVAGGESLPTAATNPDTGDNDIGILPLAFVAAVFIGTILRFFLGPLVAAVITGGLIGLFAWMIVGAAGIALLAGLAAFVFTLVGVRLFGFGGFGSGGRGGGGGGGGGTFGGGGASGKW